MKGISSMLVLSRKLNESIVIDGGIKVTVVSVHGNQVRLGIQAPESVRIFREELCGRPASRKKNGRLTSAGSVVPNSTEAMPRETTCRNP
jgi:carbon storage regulator